MGGVVEVKSTHQHSGMENGTGTLHMVQTGECEESKDGQTDGRMGQTGGQAGRQAGRQADRQAGWLAHMPLSLVWRWVTIFMTSISAYGCPALTW